MAYNKWTDDIAADDDDHDDDAGEEAIIVTWGLVTSYSLLIKPNLPCILT